MIQEAENIEQLIEEMVEYMNFEKMNSKLNDDLYELIKKEHYSNKMERNDEEEALVDSAIESYKIYEEMIDRENYNEAFAILRGVFESIIMFISIHNNNDIYNSYIKYPQTEDDRKKIKPYKLRQEAALFFTNQFKNSGIQWNNDFDEYYEILCSFVHPTIFKNYAHAISKSKYKNEDIKMIFGTIGLYCKYILLIALKSDYITNINDYISLMYVHILVAMESIKGETDIETINDECEKYLHYEINTMLNNNTNSTNSDSTNDEEVKRNIVNVNIRMYKILKIRMYKIVHFYFQLFSLVSIILSFNLYDFPFILII